MSNTQIKTRKDSENTFWVAISLAAASGITMIFTLLVADPGSELPVIHRSAPMPAPTPASMSVAEPVTSDMVMAKRIERRLKSRNLPAPSTGVLSAAWKARRTLLGHTVMLRLVPTDDSAAPAPASVTLRDHPDWMVLETTPWSAEFHVSREAIVHALDRGDIANIPLLQPSVVLAMERDPKNVMRATTATIAKSGYTLDSEAAADALASSFEDGIETLTLEAAYGEPTMIVTKPDGTTKTLTLLSEGLSDYSNSTANREHNVFKAIDERVNNVVLEPGETFSLVAALDAPVTLGKGWKEELGLFGGGAALTPGAGICQSATTLYRAAILAGLPLTDTKSHSLFVDHYEFYGIGLDATVFPGVQDLQFKNDTHDIIVIQAHIEGYIVHVNFYGEDDGRSVALDGPYFVNSKHRPSAIRPLTNKQIGWTRTITYGDGRTKVEPLIANYAKPLWNSLMKKYAEPEGMALLTQKESTITELKNKQLAEAMAATHAAAPLDPMVKADVTAQ